MIKKGILTAACAVLLLPSCMQWNIGANIREASEVRLGVNRNIQYKLPPELEERHRADAHGYSFLSPEVRYRVDVPLVAMQPPDLFDTWEKAHGQEPTGRLRVVTYVAGKGASAGEYRLGEACELDRSGLSALCSSSAKLSDSPDELGKAELERASGWPLAALAAAPFDFALDPALTLVTSPLYGLFYILAYISQS